MKRARVMSLAFAVRVVFTATLMFGLVGVAEAQQVPNRWGRDNCLYQWNGREWTKLDICRVMISATTYRTYSPMTRQWIVFVDDSHPINFDVVILSGPHTNTLFRFYKNGSPSFSLLRPGGVWENFSPAFEANRQALAKNQLDKKTQDMMNAHIVIMGMSQSKFYQKYRYQGKPWILR